MQSSHYRAISRHRLLEAGDDIWAEPTVTMEVVVEDNTPIDTGLVDQHGNKIMRIMPRAPLGFCR